MERKYYRDIGYKPFLFYVVFGVSAEELEVSRNRHKVDELPEGLDIRSLNREQHGSYLDGFLTGAMGKVLEEKDPALFRRCREAETCSILQGSIGKDTGLEKVSFHSNPKERQCQKMLKLPHNCTHLTC